MPRGMGGLLFCFARALLDAARASAIIDRIRSRCPELTRDDLLLSPACWPTASGARTALQKRPPPSALRRRKGAHDMDERPRLTASEIEAQLLAELQKLPSLRDTQSVKIRPYSGPKGWTWELDRIEAEVGPTQIKFVDMATVVGQLQQQYDFDLSPPPPT